MAWDNPYEHVIEAFKKGTGCRLTDGEVRILAEDTDFAAKAGLDVKSPPPPPVALETGARREGIEFVPAEEGATVPPEIQERSEAVLKARRDVAAVSEPSWPTGTITSFTGKWRFLSNFYPATAKARWNDDETKVPTLEHAYQAAKAVNREDFDRICAYPTPGQANRIGNEIVLRSAWNDEFKLRVMRALVREKFMEHPDLEQQLLATGETQIIDGNSWGDTFWGITEEGEGLNHLGRILMDTRAALRAIQKVEATVQPGVSGSGTEAPPTSSGASDSGTGKLESPARSAEDQHSYQPDQPDAKTSSTSAGDVGEDEPYAGPEVVISGGQTGADIAGLVIAKHFGIATGGWAPHGWQTSVGPQKGALQSFGLREHDGGYAARTCSNVIDSSATLILSVNPDSPGTRLTKKVCREMGRPHFLVDPLSPSVSAQVTQWICDVEPQVLNIAGNRQPDDNNPDIYGVCCAVLEQAFNCVMLEEVKV